MAGNFFGADVDQLRQLSRSLAQNAEQLQAIIGRLSPRVDSTAWRGPDAERFRSEWNESLVAKVNAAIRALSDASGLAETNARQQEQASGGGAGFGVSSTPIWPFRAPRSFGSGAGTLPDTFGYSEGMAEFVDQLDAKRAPWLFRDFFPPGPPAGVEGGDLVDFFQERQSPMQRSRGGPHDLFGPGEHSMGFRDSGSGFGSIVGPGSTGIGLSPYLNAPNTWQMTVDFATPIADSALVGGVVGATPGMPPIAKNFRFW